MIWPRLSAPIHYSWYPRQAGAASLCLFSSLAIALKISRRFPLVLGLLLVSLCLFLWWDLLLIESEAGEMSFQDCDNIKFRLALFILSEAMFLVTFFWTFFHFALSPSIWGGLNFPPVGLLPIDPKGLPLLNTFLLVRRGVTVTWGHHLLLSGESVIPCRTLFFTSLLGAWFLLNQGLEFKEATLTVADGVYGRVFLVLTGLHGFHVLLGAALIIERAAGLLDFQYTSHCHPKTEIFIWYWHFVDCIWLIVYSLVYWWGG